MKRFIIIAGIAGAILVAGASAASAATCNVTLSSVAPHVRGSVTVSWTLSSTSPCAGATVEIVKPAAAGGGTVTLGTGVTSITWNTLSGQFADAGGYTIRVTPVANSGHNPGNAKTAVTTVDNTAPAITLTSRTAANDNGWNNTAVSLAWSCVDANPNTAASTTAATRSDEGAAQSASGTCVDLAGNSSSDTVSDINIDLTVPSVAFVGRTDPNEAGWNNTAVGLTWSCEDALSGTSASELNATLSADGVDQSAGAICTDRAGNSAHDIQQDIDIDTTAPSIALASRTEANAEGWNNTPVSVEWTCDDALSGTTAPGATAVLNDDGAGQSASGTCADVAGNSAQLAEGDINIDQVDPSIDFVGRTAPNDNGWNNSPVTATWSCSDALSGAVAPSVSDLLEDDGADLIAAATCSDVAGNTASDSVGDIDIDTTAPAIALASRTAANDAGWNNTVVELAWSCEDQGSGVVAASVSRALTADGAGQSGTGVCTDLAGNTADDTVSNINIDTVGPVATIKHDSALDGVLLPGAPISGTATDSLSGVARVTVTFTNALGDTTIRTAAIEGSTWSVSTEGLAPGSYTVVARAEDVADNAGAPTAATTFLKTL